MRAVWMMAAKGTGGAARSIGRARDIEPGHRRDGIALVLLGLAVVVAASSWFDAARPLGAWIGDQRDDLVVGGQPRGGDPGGHHRRIAQHRGTGGQRGTRPRDDVVGVGHMLGDVDLPAGVNQPNHHPRDVGGEARQIGLGADNRE